MRRVERLHKYAMYLYSSNQVIIVIFTSSHHDEELIAVQGKTGQIGEPKNDFYIFFICSLPHTLLAVLLVCNSNYFLVPLALSLRSSSSSPFFSILTHHDTNKKTQQILSYLDVRAKQ